MDAPSNEKTSPAIGHCRDCRWWSDVIPKTDKSRPDERICLMSKKCGFGLYGQDGKAVITGPSFGCVAFIPKAVEEQPITRRVCRETGLRVAVRNCLHVAQCSALAALPVPGDQTCPLEPKP